MKSVNVSELIDFLRDHGLKCSFAESLTGGMIASGIVDVAGASDVFEGSIISYSDAFKINVLGVPSEVIKDKDSSFFRVYAEAMAEGALRLSHAELAVAISVTGYA